MNDIISAIITDYEYYYQEVIEEKKAKIWYDVKDNVINVGLEDRKGNAITGYDYEEKIK